MSILNLVLGFSLGGPEIIVIVLVIIFFFGAKKIPEIARGLGKSVNEFKKGQNESSSAEERDSSVPPQEKL